MNLLHNTVKAATNMFVLTSSMESKVAEPVARISSGVIATALCSPMAAPALQKAMLLSFDMRNKAFTKGINLANKSVGTNYSVEQARDNNSRVSEIGEMLGNATNNLVNSDFGVAVIEEAISNKPIK